MVTQAFSLNICLVYCFYPPLYVLLFEVCKINIDSFWMDFFLNGLFILGGEGEHEWEGQMERENQKQTLC